MSIVYQYENSSLQFSDTFGNIGHQGVLASNLNGSPALTDFPTTSTGTSLGHYHYTDDTTKALKFLNVSGSGSGGHWFYTANDTIAPVQTARIDTDGITVDTSSGGGSVVYSPNVDNISPDNIHINFPDGTNLNDPPYNFNQTFNPVYMTQTTAFYTAGDLCYAVLGNISQVTIFNNDNTTNPIPPNVVPTGFPTADATGIQVGIPLFTLSPIPPTIPKTINLLENLTIVNDTDTSILSATDLTFNGINVKMNQVQSTLIYSSPAIYADGHEPANGLAIRNAYGYSGWFYKNSPPNSSPTNKINWYFPPKSTTTTVAELKGIAISFFNGVTVSNDDTLYLTVYTRPTGSNDYAPNFFHSAMTYVFDQTITPTANTNYQGVCIIDKSFIPYNYETQIQYEPSTVNNPRGSYSQTDNILAVVIGTNSASATNSVELVVNKLNLIYADFTQSYLLVPP